MADNTAETGAVQGLLIVEGGFEDQAAELTSYLERVQKSRDDVFTEDKLFELLKKGENEEIIATLTAESTALSDASEKDFEPAYNLLIHLVLTSKSPQSHLAKIIANLATPPSFSQGPTVAVAVLSTIFNLIPEQPQLQFSVFKTILSISQEHNLYEYISPYFKSVNEWLKEWNVSEVEQRQIWGSIIAIAETAEDPELYHLLVGALGVAAPEESKALVLKTIRVAVDLPQVFDFQKLASTPAAEQLATEKDPACEFLQILLTGTLESYRAFIASHPTFLADNHIDASKTERKVRLLTLATLSNTPTRTLPYSQIASSLDIPPTDVELWLIDVIRAGLVEGKLSQARQELLVHRSTYRSFGRAEWEEIESRLEDWRVALEGVLGGEQIAALKEQEGVQQQQVNGTSA